MACDGNVTCAEEVRDELVNGLQSLWLLLCTWLGGASLTAFSGCKFNIDKEQQT